VEGDFELKYLYCSRLAEDLSPPLPVFFFCLSWHLLLNEDSLRVTKIFLKQVNDFPVTILFSALANHTRKPFRDSNLGDRIEEI